MRALALLAVILVAAPGCSREEPPDATGPEAGAARPAAAPPSAATAGPDHHDDAGALPHRHEDDGGPVVRLSPVERDNIGLRTESVARRPLEDTRRFPGVIKPHPDRVALVTSRTPGRIVNIHARVGERVTKGQDLIEVQSVEVERLELDLIQAENRYRTERAKLELALAQVRTQVRVAQAEAERHRALVQKGIGARKELIAAENQLATVDNEIAGLIRQIELLAEASDNEVAGLTRQLELLGLPGATAERVRRDRSVTLLHVPAPLGGVIIERPVNLGQIIDTTATLFRIIDDSTVIAEGEAFEDVLPSLRVGQPVRVTVQAYPRQVFPGRLTFIHPVIDPERRTARIWAELPNADHRLKQDMFVEVGVVVGGGAPGLTVPVAAVIAAEGGEFVFVERGDGFARVRIATGARNDQLVEVRRGLHAGDRVVTDGKRQVYTKLLTIQRGGAELGGHTH